MVKKKSSLTIKNKSKQKKNSGKRINEFRRLFLSFIVFLFFLFIFIFLSLMLIFKNRILPNTKVGNVDVSFKTRNQALNALQSSYRHLSNVEFRLKYEGKEWLYHPADWNIKIDFEKSVDNALSLYKHLWPANNIVNFLNLQKEIITVPLVIDLDEDLFASSTATIIDEIEVPMIPPSLVVENNQVKLNAGNNGRRIEREMLKNKIIQSINQNTSYNIDVPVVIVKPPIGKLEETATLERANLLLSKKLIIIMNEVMYEIKNQELISLLSFNGGFNTEKIASLTANLAKAFDKEPQNAAFSFENGRVTVFKPSKNGQKINQQSAIAEIMNTLLKLEATTSAELVLNLPISEITPEISTNEVNDLGIKELLGKGFSYFRGSIASRIHNIILASSKLNGLLIKPGEVFSFNQALGDVSLATGFQQAYVIQNGRTVLGDGGGVCQVSTTLFRAALNAGLPIVERHAHAYRVSYYEQGFGPGLDATVFSPSVDLKIKNDTPAHILIQTNVDRENSRLTFELYGSSDGRISYVGTPRVWDQTPPPPPRYEDDPTLPVGQVKQVDWAAWGAKAAFDYKVTRGNEVLIDKTFYSNFRPWQAVYLMGTKQ